MGCSYCPCEEYRWLSSALCRLSEAQCHHCSWSITTASHMWHPWYVCRLFRVLDPWFGHRILATGNVSQWSEQDCIPHCPRALRILSYAGGLLQRSRHLPMRNGTSSLWSPRHFHQPSDSGILWRCCYSFCVLFCFSVDCCFRWNVLGIAQASEVCFPPASGQVPWRRCQWWRHSDVHVQDHRSSRLAPATGRRRSSQFCGPRDILSPFRSALRPHCRPSSYPDSQRSNIPLIASLCRWLPPSQRPSDNRSSPQLSRFQPIRRTICSGHDASAYGMGAVLSQHQKGRDHVIACNSKLFSKPQRQDYKMPPKLLLARSVLHCSPFHPDLWCMRYVQEYCVQACSITISHGWLPS